MNEVTGEISNSESVITPQVNIVNLNATSQEFNTGATVEFFISSLAIDTSLFDVTNDFCLARASDANTWECTSQRAPTILDDGFWSFPITQMGIYSIVVNPYELTPDPEPTPGPDPTPDPGPDPGPDPVDPEEGGDEEGEDGFSLLLIIILGGALLALIIIIVIIWCCCCRKREGEGAAVALAPAVISDTAINQINERERLLKSQPNVST